VLKLNYSISAFCITQEHVAPFSCSLDRGDCLACFVLFHYIDFHRWFHTISEASFSPLYCQSFCVLERRYGAYFSRICSAIIPDNSTVAGDHGRILWIRCATCLASRSLTVFLLVTFTSIPYITVIMAASHVCLSSTQHILTRPLLILSSHLSFTAEATSYTLVLSNPVCFLLMDHPPECQRPNITGCCPFQIIFTTCWCISRKSWFSCRCTQLPRTY
jgi:hypothetical protein